MTLGSFDELRTGAAQGTLVIEHAHVHTADAERNEDADGRVVCVDGVVAAVGAGPADPSLRLLLVRGEAVVSGGTLTTVDVDRVAAEVAASSRALLQRYPSPRRPGDACT